MGLPVIPFFSKLMKLSQPVPGIMSGITKILHLHGGLYLRRKSFRTISSTCECLSKSNDISGPKMTAETFKFSKSKGHPSGNNLFQNVYKTSPSVPSQRMIYFINFARVAVPFCVAFLLYLAFTSDYDLAQEEMYMQTLPGYEEEMMKSERYATRIKELQKQRDLAK